jgi:hypothetical protein
MHFTTALPALALFSSALAAAIPAQSPNENFIARRAVSGKSTFYGGNVQGGTCSFSTYTLPSGLYGTAFSGQAWNNAANCGGCVKVTHAGKSVTAMVNFLLFLVNRADTNHSILDRRQMPRMRRRPPRPLLRRLRCPRQPLKGHYRHQLRVRRVPESLGPAHHPHQVRRLAVLVFRASRQRQPPHVKARGVHRRQDLESGCSQRLQLL